MNLVEGGGQRRGVHNSVLNRYPKNPGTKAKMLDYISEVDIIIVSFLGLE